MKFLLSIILFVFPSLAFGMCTGLGVDMNNNTQLMACVDFCRDNPTHYACNWNCEENTCVPEKPDCTNPSIPGCNLFCINTPSDPACSYFCAINPDACANESGGACSLITDETECGKSQDCKIMYEPPTTVCREEFAGCDLKVSSDYCEGLTEVECLTRSNACEAERLVFDDNDLNDLYVGCNLKTVFERQTCLESDENSCETTLGCESKKIEKCLSQTEICTSYNDELDCISDSKCTFETGRCTAKRIYTSCINKEVALDPCLLNPMSEQCVWDVSKCSEYPGFWKCNMRALITPEAVSGFPDRYMTNPEMKINDFIPPCPYASFDNLNQCNDFCKVSPDHWACNWDCQDADNPICEQNPLPNCSSNPSAPGCEGFCKDSPTHPSCAYICSVTSVCENANNPEYRVANACDSSGSLSSSDYDRRCNNVCQIGMPFLSSEEVNLYCHGSCQIDAHNSDCAPGAVINKNKGIYAKPYCAIKSSDPNCSGDTTKTFCESLIEIDVNGDVTLLNPDPKYEFVCSKICESLPTHESCPHYCEIHPADPDCFSLDQDGDVIEVSTKIDNANIEETQFDLVDFCGINVIMSDLEICGGAGSTKKSFCEVQNDLPDAPVMMSICHSDYRVEELEKRCESGGDLGYCLNDPFIFHHKGLSEPELQQPIPPSDIKEYSFLADDAPIEITLSYPDATNAGTPNPGLYVGPEQQFRPHVWIGKNPDGTGGYEIEEIFINPGLVGGSSGLYKWDINQHSFSPTAGDPSPTELPIFSQTGIYEFKIGLCKGSGFCDYTPKQKIHIMPAEVASVKLRPLNTTSGIPIESNGEDETVIEFWMKDRFGNAFTGTNGRGMYRAKILDQTSPLRYDMHKFNGLPSLDIFRNALRFKNTSGFITEKSEWEKVGIDGRGEIKLVSFLPSAQVWYSACGPREFYALGEVQPTPVRIQLEYLDFDIHGNPVAGGLNHSLSPLSVQVEFDKPYEAGIAFPGGDIANPVPIMTPPYSLDLYDKNELSVGVNERSATELTTHHAYDHLKVLVNGFIFGGRMFHDTKLNGTPVDPEMKNVLVNFSDTKISKDNQIIEMQAVKSGKGRLSPDIPAFSTLISYTVPFTSQPVSYPGFAFSKPSYCPGTGLADLPAGVIVPGPDENIVALLAVKDRILDVEGLVLNLDEMTQLTTASEGIDLNAEGVDRSSLRSGIQEMATRLVFGNEESSFDLITTQDDFDDMISNDGDVSYFNGKTVVIAPKSDGPYKLSGKHTILIEDGNLYIGADLVYEDELDDSWGFVLINSELSNPYDAEAGVYDSILGTIFVHEDVKQIVGTYFTDGTFTSSILDPGVVEADPSTLNILDTAMNRSADDSDGGNDSLGTAYTGEVLRKQLVLTGSLMSQNTLGRSQTAPPVDPWGNEVPQDQAKIFDLNYVRQFLYDTSPEFETRCSHVKTSNLDRLRSGHGTCYANPFPFVIHIDNKVQTNPPPAFILEQGHSVSGQ